MTGETPYNATWGSPQTATATDVVFTAIKAALRPYQLRWMLEGAGNPFFALLGGRQIGKTKGLAADFAAEAIMVAGSRWNLFSASQHHANEMLADVRGWYNYLAEVLQRHGYAVAQPVTDNMTTLALDNGSVIHSRPATRRAGVGLRGSVGLDEVGVIPRVRELFEALYPIVTGARDNGHDARFKVWGNAAERGSWWHTFWTGDQSGDFAKVTQTWRTAFESIGKGTEWIAERIKRYVRAIGRGGYAQWYDCKWRAAEELFLSPALLERQTYDPAEVDVDWTSSELWQRVGYDVGRHRDPSAVAPLVQHGTKHYLQPVTYMHNTPYKLQRVAVMRVATQRQTSEILIDSTGMGDTQYEALAEEAPCTVTPINFSGADTKKQNLFDALKDGLETGQIWIPGSDLDTRMQLESVQQHMVNGRPKIVLPREGGAHCDGAVAAALAAFGAMGRTGHLDHTSFWE